MSEYGIFWGDELLKFNPQSLVPIVDGLLWENDMVFMIAKEKAGKTIFAIQLLCSITTGERFMDNFEVFRPLEVCYIQTEGKRYSTQERLNNMRAGIALDESKFTHIYQPGIALNTKHGYEAILGLLKAYNRKPKVICIDPLYMSIDGNMSDAQAASAWLLNARRLQNEYGAAMFIIHHTHKDRRTDKGRIIDEGDDAIFGSYVWKANADHVLLLKYDKREKTHTLTCNTQREAKVVTNVNFVLLEPRPLLYTLADRDSNKAQLVLVGLLATNPEGLTAKQLEDMSSFSVSTIYRNLKTMTEAKTVEAISDTTPTIYKKPQTTIPKP